MILINTYTPTFLKMVAPTYWVLPLDITVIFRIKLIETANRCVQH